jgi:hypothetical protein
VNPRIAPAAVGLAVLVWQILSMPGATLPADPWAPRAEAEILLREGRWGLTPAEAALWPGLIETPGQYFFHNPATGRFYSKYGVLNTALALPPRRARAVGLSRRGPGPAAPVDPQPLQRPRHGPARRGPVRARAPRRDRRIGRALDGGGPVFGFPVVLHPGAIGGGLARFGFHRRRLGLCPRPGDLGPSAVGPGPVGGLGVGVSGGRSRFCGLPTSRGSPGWSRACFFCPAAATRAALRPRWPSL